MENSGFSPIDQSLIGTLENFYLKLENPLADLNATMMVAWQEILGLNYYIDKHGILFVYGRFEGQYYGWGPPLGRDVSISHIDQFLDLLDRMNGHPSSILYLWKGHPLYETLTSVKEFNISEQASEYIYASDTLGNLSSNEMRSFRKNRDYFFRKHQPETKMFSPALATDCLMILDKWIKQKESKVPEDCRDKFSIEANVCRSAIEKGLPMSGVVIYVDSNPVAFSIGGEHSKDCFNCMFEKTDLSMNGLSIVVFSELGRCLSRDYVYINAGEDWGVPYLKKTKLKWLPINIQESFQISRNIQ